MATNSKQNIITAIAIIVALAAIVYAFMLTTQKTVTEVEGESAQVVEAQEESYEEGDQNPVVLTVDGREVTRMEVMDNFASSGSQIPDGADMEQIFPLLQEQYLISHLLNDAARNSGVNGTDPEVAKRVEEARVQALRAVYIDKISNEAVTDDDVRQAYDDIVSNAEAIMERRARHILVDTEDAANALILKLENGADFEKLATENSTGPSAQNGGDLGYFAASEMVPAFAEAAFTMDVGDYTKQPVKTQFGYHVIKVEDERAREKPTFEEMRSQLEQQLRQAVVREKINELREKSNVMIYDYQGNPVVRPEAEAQPEASVSEEAPASVEDENVEVETPVDTQVE